MNKNTHIHKFRGETWTSVTSSNTRFPFDRFLGLRGGGNPARLRAPAHALSPRIHRRPASPALHGGLISMLVDTCGGSAVWAACSVRDRVATIDMRVDYLRPADPADLIAIGEVKLLGNRVGNATVQIFSAQPRRGHRRGPRRVQHPQGRGQGPGQRLRWTVQDRLNGLAQHGRLP
jgi:uncharacterized protein (TIGR00369 family)